MSDDCDNFDDDEVDVNHEMLCELVSLGEVAVLEDLFADSETEFNLDRRDFDGETPLSIAIGDGDTSCALFLV